MGAQTILLSRVFLAQSLSGGSVERSRRLQESAQMSDMLAMCIQRQRGLSTKKEALGERSEVCQEP